MAIDDLEGTARRGSHFAAPGDAARHRFAAAEHRARAPRPDETAVFLAAARGERAASPKGLEDVADASARDAAGSSVLSSNRPDETSVFLAAAASRRFLSTTDPGSTSVFLAAAGQGGRVAPGDPLPQVKLPDLDDDIDEEWLFSRAADERDALASFENFMSEPDETVDGDAVDAVGATPEHDDDMLEAAEKSSNMVSMLVIISRITGFFRTAVQAWAMGAAMLASCYTIANQLPNMLYELVVGGMLITAFLPVYVKVRDKVGREGAGEYASNLLSILTVIMLVITVVSFVFAAPIVWTQSAGAADGFDSDLAVWFFRWFSVEIVLYALSSVFSGVLNAEREYVASNAAPILNNIIVILSFAGYGLLSHVNSGLAMMILAVGNPLGVLAQVLVQIPSLGRHGVHLSLRMNLADPALRETISIGLPTLFITLVGYPTLAVLSSCAMQVTSSGAAALYYSRVWYVLPYSIFAVPISVTMFTELSHYFAQGDMASFKQGFSRGLSKIVFTTIPFSMFLILFARCLINILASGKFDAESVEITTVCLAGLAVGLVFNCVFVYLQKACSAMLSMKFFALAVVISAVAEIVFCFVFVPSMGIAAVGLSQTVYYVLADAVVLVRLRGQLGGLGMRSVLSAAARGLVFGTLGTLVGWGILQGLTMSVGPLEGAMRGLMFAVVAGLPAVLVTFGLAYALGKSDAPFFDSIFDKLFGRRAAAV